MAASSVYGVPPPLPASYRHSSLLATLIRVGEPYGLLKELCHIIANYADGSQLYIVARAHGVVRGVFRSVSASAPAATTATTAVGANKRQRTGDASTGDAKSMSDALVYAREFVARARAGAPAGTSAIAAAATATSGVASTSASAASNTGAARKRAHSPPRVSPITGRLALPNDNPFELAEAAAAAAAEQAAASPPPPPDPVAVVLASCPYELVLDTLPFRHSTVSFPGMFDTRFCVVLRNTLYWLLSGASTNQLFRYDLSAPEPADDTGTITESQAFARDEFGVGAGPIDCPIGDVAFYSLTAHPRANTLVIAGGQVNLMPRSTVWTYDATTGKWSMMRQLPITLLSHCTVISSTPTPVATKSGSRGSTGGDPIALDEYMYVLGGRSHHMNNPHALAYRYSFQSRVWEPIAPMRDRREEFSSVALLDGSVVASGGSAEWVIRGLQAVERYVPAENKWYSLPPMNGCRLFHSLVRLADDSLLAFAGFSGTAMAGLKCSLEYLPASALTPIREVDASSSASALLPPPLPHASQWLPIPLRVDGTRLRENQKFSDDVLVIR